MCTICPLSLTIVNTAVQPLQNCSVADNSVKYVHGFSGIQSDSDSREFSFSGAGVPRWWELMTQQCCPRPPEEGNTPPLCPPHSSPHRERPNVLVLLFVGNGHCLWWHYLGYVSCSATSAWTLITPNLLEPTQMNAKHDRNRIVCSRATISHRCRSKHERTGVNVA